MNSRRKKACAAAALALSATSFVSVLGDGQEKERRGPGGLEGASGSPETTAREGGSSPASSIDRLAITTVGPTEYQYEVVDGEVLVRFQPGTTLSQVSELARKVGSRILEQGTLSGLYRLVVPEGETIARFQGLMRRTPLVADVSPDAVAVATGCPTAEHRSRLWNLDRIQSDEACSSYSNGLSDVVVAVLDTGVAYEDYSDGQGTYARASDLANVSFVSGYDFVNEDSHPNDDNQHGTHIAGVIAAQGKVMGVAPGVKVMPVKVLGANKRGTELDVIEGIRYAVDHGADVINMSLSFGPGYFPSTGLQDAISYASAQGVVLVASAGNDSRWGISYPAAFPEVISVGAGRLSMKNSSELGDSQAYYSNKGYRLDLIAPGGLVNADVTKRGKPDSILAQTFRLNQPNNIGYWYISGTSQAAAHVSGAAAWLLADGVAPDQVKPLLQAGANRMGLSEFDPLVGAGNLQIEAARDLETTVNAVKPPKYYVNLVPRLRTGAGGGLEAVVRLEVMDGEGRAAGGVRVGGSWRGSVTGFDALATTNSSGVAEVVSDEVFSTSGVAVGFQVDMVVAPGTGVSSQPTQFYSLSPAYGELFHQVLQDPLTVDAAMLFKLDPADAGLDGLIDRTGMVTSYMMTPLAGGLPSGPFTVVIDDAFAPEVTQASSPVASNLSWTFPAQLISGRGSLSGLEGTLVNTTSSRLGAVSKYLIVPLDPAMGTKDLGQYYPVLNSLGPTFAQENETFGNGFLQSTVGTGFAQTSMGTGFLQSTVGTGFLQSTVGTGFLQSTVGTGFLQSTVGTNFSSILKATSMMVGAIATGFQETMDDSGEGESYEVQAASEDDLLGTELDEVDPSQLLDSETAVIDFLGVSAYPTSN